VDDILLISSDLNMLFETKYFLSKKFDMKDLDEAGYVIGIEIQRDRSSEILDLSHKVYIEKYLNVTICKITLALIVKGDKFSKF
jgi:Reverse transcriptase (RNA-dependent DNA polymerase)